MSDLINTAIYLSTWIFFISGYLLGFLVFLALAWFTGKALNAVYQSCQSEFKSAPIYSSFMLVLFVFLSSWLALICSGNLPSI